MGTESREPPADLSREEWERALEEAPESFAFFQAVRLLHRRLGDRRKVGEFADPAGESVRFSVNPSLAFPAGDIQDMRVGEDGQPRMSVNFMGLVGHMGVLPTQYSMVLDAQAAEEGDPDPLRDFLDIFHHRLLSLFYGAWERSHFYVPFERQEEDRVSARLLDLIGLGTPGLRRKMSVRDDALLFYCGLLGIQQRSAVALEHLLEDYFGVPVEVLQFHGGWYGLSESSQCRLDDDEGLAGSLGEGTVVGDEIWDPQARVRIRVGPLSREKYDDFLPGGPAYEALAGFTRFFGDGHYDFDLQLVLDRDDVPGVVLGSEEESAPPLGWCTWIRTRPFSLDPDETILSI